MKLSVKERAILVSRLLSSFPAVLSDADEGVAEALRRDAEMEQNPATSLAWEDLKQSIKR